MISYIRLMRPKHYLKNFLVLIPLFFSKIKDIKDLFPVIIGFFSFSIISSTIYVINDIMDAEKDRKHPKKCKRPIASEKISKQKATAFSIFLFFSAICLHCLTVKNFFSIATIYIFLYFFINLSYSLGLKNKPILDVTLLSSGFLLRVLYGGAISKITISHWLYLVIVTFSFYMGFGKRRGEIRLSAKKNTRNVLKKYNYEFLDKNMNIFTGLTLVFYSLWTVDKKTIDIIGNDFFIWTVPLVILIFLRYSYLIEIENSDGDPVEVLFSDKMLIILVILYILMTITFFYNNLFF